MTPNRHQNAPERKKTKYGNCPVVVDSIRFASQREARRYAELKRLQRAGKISDLELQPAFPVRVNGRHICTYRADFAYVEEGRRIVEDVKGVRTPVYRLKKKLVEAIYGIEIQET